MEQEKLVEEVVEAVSGSVLIEAEQPLLVVEEPKQVKPNWQLNKSVDNHKGAKGFKSQHRPPPPPPKRINTRGFKRGG